MQRSATDADPMNDAQLETELNMIQERRAAEMKDVAKMDARLAALAEEKAKIAARRAAAMGEVAKMDSRTAEIKGQRASRAATSRASAASASPMRKPTLNEVDRAADLAGDSPSPENELKKQYKLHKAQCAAQLAELALAPASSDSAANDAELNGYLHRVEHRGPPAPNRFEPAQTKASLAKLTSDAHKAAAALKLYLANSPIKDTDRKKFVEADWAEAKAAFRLYLANSPIKDTDRKKFVDAEILRTDKKEFGRHTGRSLGSAARLGEDTRFPK